MFFCYTLVMDFFGGYLAVRFVYRIGDFFHHWYVDGSRAILRKFVQVAHDLEQTFALRVTLMHFSEPLYKDYTTMGRILGVIFRTGRIIVAGFTYLVLAIFGAMAYVAWLAIPALIAFFIIKG